jgi:hypothetical protein
MTTAPETATPAVNSAIAAKLKADWTWLVSHLVAIAFVALLVVGAVYGVDSIVAKHDAAANTKYAAILQQQTAQTQTLIQQLAADQAASAARDAQYTATIAQLSKSIQVRDANAQKQQQADTTLDATSAGARLAQQTNAKAGEITVANDSITLDLPLTRGIIGSLDSLAALQADFQDTKNQLTAQTGLTADANTKLADADKVIASQTLQLADSTKACQAQVKSLKAHYRKKLIKVGVISYVAGFVSGVIATLAK